MKGRKQQHSAKKVKTQSKQHTKSAKATNTKNTKKGTRKSRVNRRMKGGDPGESEKDGTGGVKDGTGGVWLADTLAKQQQDAETREGDRWWMAGGATVVGILSVALGSIVYAYTA